MMNKIVNLRHIAVIVSVVIMAIGMAVGTICHFVSNGFFNYGDEFASYKSVEVTTSVPEDINGELLGTIAADELSSLGAYEVSFAEGSGIQPNTVIYKFPASASDSDLQAAVDSIIARFEERGLEDGSASLHSNTGVAGGIWQLNYAAIALASAVVIQAIYFAIRLKPGMALSAVLSQLAAVGVYASLLAITRCPVGLEAIALAAVLTVITMICNGIFFGKVKSLYKDESNAKADKLSLVATGAESTAKFGAFICIAFAAAAVIFAVFALIASPSIQTILPYVVCIIAAAACAYNFAVFAPANYAQLCGIDRRGK